MTIDNWRFENNLAVNGGAIYLGCDYLKVCRNSITNSVFTGNNATINGGAISYTSYRPTFSNNYFENNSAVYGNDIASFPSKILQDLENGSFSDLLSINDAPSGSPIQNSIPLVIVDEDFNVMVSII